jgi:hypothetical protein
MVKFAFECLVLMHDLTRKLESSLGPGTADFAIRIGLHSGPVIAGVLRGERARFQLLGDTMNVASRMQSTGKVPQIQASKETAQLALQAGKSDWVEQRDELVGVKGKGQPQTYWVKPTKPLKRSSSEKCNGMKGGMLANRNVDNAESRNECLCSNKLVHGSCVESIRQTAPTDGQVECGADAPALLAENCCQVLLRRKAHSEL